MQVEKLNLEVEHVSTHRQHSEALFLLQLTMYIGIQNRAAPLASVEKIRKFIWRYISSLKSLQSTICEAGLVWICSFLGISHLMIYDQISHQKGFYPRMSECQRFLAPCWTIQVRKDSLYAYVLVHSVDQMTRVQVSRVSNFRKGGRLNPLHLTSCLWRFWEQRPSTCLIPPQQADFQATMPTTVHRMMGHNPGLKHCLQCFYTIFGVLVIGGVMMLSRLWFHLDLWLRWVIIWRPGE
jgi:hypothetical protein